MAKIKSITELGNLDGYRVLLRSDLNLSIGAIGKDANSADMYKLEKSLATIKLLLKKRAKIFIASHLGQPKQPEEDLSLKPLTKILTKKLGHKVGFIADPFHLGNLQNLDQDIYLLENVRFWPGEEQNQKDYALGLLNSLSLDIFVQDAFGVAHRSHATNMQLPALLPSYTGLLIEEELSALTKFQKVKNPTLLIGGAKVESKLILAENYLGRARQIIFGGVVLNTFLQAKSKKIGLSLVDSSCTGAASKILAKAKKEASTKLFLAEDFLCGRSPKQVLAEECDLRNFKGNEIILDIGRLSLSKILQALEDVQPKLYFWSGTMGYAENPAFKVSSAAVLKKLIEIKKMDSAARIVIGGGDTIGFVRAQLSLADLAEIDHLSTGGGAFLKFLSGAKLPAIQALEDSKVKFEPRAPQKIKAKAEIEPKIESKIKDESKIKLTRTEVLLAKSSQRKKTGLSLAENELSSRRADYPPKPTSTTGRGLRLAVNLKANFNRESFRVWADLVMAEVAKLKPSKTLLLGAPDIFLDLAEEIIKKHGAGRYVDIFVEDISAFSEGSYTGEVAAAMLQGLASGTILGHSERRTLFHESNSEVGTKLKAALDANLKVILCIGGVSKDLVTNKRETQIQLISAIKILPSSQNWQTGGMCIAYEPVFAIGAGVIPSKTFLAAQLKAIKIILDSHNLSKVEILYGGSVDHTNIEQVLDLGFSGVLVGSASLNARELFKLMATVL